MANVGYATLQIIPSAQGFASSLTGQTTGAMAVAGTKGGEVGGKALGGGLLAGVKGMAGPLAAVFAGMQVVDFLGDAVADFREAEKVSRVLAQELKTTGATAWTSAGQIDDYATALMNKIAVDDDAIKANETLLLSFTNVRNAAGAGNDIFNRTTELAYDMAQVVGTDAASSMMMLGKALNDPADGLAKLTRVGVQFTDQQKEQIKALAAAGDTLGAQRLILAEIQHEFGGAAASAVDPAEKLSVAWGNLKESVGSVLVPALNTVIDSVTPVVLLLTDKLAPAGKAVTDSLGSIGTALDFLFGSGGETQSVEAFGGAMDSAFGSTGRFIEPLTQVGTALLSIKDSATTAWSSFVTAFGPVRPILDNLKTVFAERLAVVKKIITDLAPAFDGLKEKVGPLFAKIGEAFRAFAGMIAPVASAVTTVLEVLWDLLGPTVVSIVKNVFGAVVGILSGAFTIIKGIFEVITGLFTGDWAKLWQGVKDIFGGAWEAIKSVLGAALQIVWDLIVRIFGGIGTWLADKWRSIVAGVTGAWNTVKAATMNAWNAAVDFVKTAIGNFVANVRALPGRVAEFVSQVVENIRGMGSRALAAITDLPGKFMSFAGDVIGGFVQGIKNKAGAVITTIKTYVLDKLPAFVKDFFGIHSPSKMFAEFGGYLMQGLAQGIRDDASGVMRAVRAVSDGIANTQLSLPVPAGGVAGALAAAGAASQKTLNYYAAPGSGLSSEEDLFAAADRTRMVW